MALSAASELAFEGDVGQLSDSKQAADFEPSSIERSTLTGTCGSFAGSVARASATGSPSQPSFLSKHCLVQRRGMI